jgi:hypothetical protein
MAALRHVSLRLIATSSWPSTTLAARCDSPTHLYSLGLGVHICYLYRR